MFERGRIAYMVLTAVRFRRLPVGGCDKEAA